MAPAIPKTLDLLRPVLDRRSAIRLGVGGLAGGSFFNLLGMQQAARAASGKKPSSCILIWMDVVPRTSRPSTPSLMHRSRFAVSSDRSRPM